MRRISRLIGLTVLGVILLGIAALLLIPSARRLAPLYLYYDLVGRLAASAPPEVEQFV